MSGVEMTIRKINLELDKARVEKLYKFENELYSEGYNLIAGVDEAGRGSLVGPLIVGAVILPPNFYLERLDDSKKLSPKIREKLYYEIVYNAVAVASVAVDIAESDKLNVYRATLKGMIRAVDALNVQPDFVLVDAMKIYFKNIPVKSIIHGDALSASIAAASIVAKVTRDRLADDWAKKYPIYNFEKNRGYGTPEHMKLIKEIGFTDIHRRSFQPVKDMIQPVLPL